jgi:hypothetical protein
MSKSTRLIAFSVLVFALPVSLLPLFSNAALAQSQQSAVAAFGMGPDGTQLGESSDAGGTPVWVDTIDKTFIEGWTEYNTKTCADISTGSYTVKVAPKKGKLFFAIVNGTLSNGACPGVTFPFHVAYYTWTDANQSVLQDPFTLDWKTPDGKFNDVNSFTGELAKITQAKSVWWACGVSGGTLPNTGTLTLTNPPSGAKSFVWTITAGATDLVYSSGRATITTTTDKASVKTLAASTAMNSVSMKVVVKNLTYVFKTTVRTPKQLKRRTDLDRENGRGASCAVSGTEGFQSLVGYEVDDQFGVNSKTPDNSNAGVNELLGAKTNHQTNNWTVPKAGGSATPGGVFDDNLCFTTKTWKPNPKPPQSPLTTDLVDTIPQTWFTGSKATPPPNKGCKAQTDTINFFIDHGSHTNIKSPPAGADSAAQVSSAQGATAYPTPVPNVAYLADQSGVIVKGRILEVNETGTITKATEDGLVTLHEMAASVQVDNVLKGNVEAKVITVDWLEDRGALVLTLEQDEYTLLFLNSGKDGTFTFADAQVGKLPITSQNVPSAEAARDTEGRLEGQLMASLSDPDREVARTALEQVGNLGHVRSTEAIRMIASGSTPDFQGLAYRALLRLGDFSLLDQAIRYAEQPAQELELRRLQLAVAEAIGDIEDRSVVPALNSLLSSPSVDLRRAAAMALRTIGDPSGAGSLVRALDDSDRDVQYDAVMALSSVAGASPDNAPARDIFDQAPAKYLNYWKSWWDTSGRSR